MSPCSSWRCLASSVLMLMVLAAIIRAEQEVIVAIDEPGKTQYHEANFNTSSYQYGYEVGPNGQFHHETRGPDGVTYGCYGYIDPNGQLRVTHYVADTHGYRVVEPNRPVEIFVDAPTQYSSNSIAEDEPQERRRGELRPWTELYLPKGCGMFPGGMRPDGSGGSTPPGGISLGAGVSTAGISGMASTSHTGPNHNVAGTIGGSVGTSTGVQASGAANASATILGATIDHTHTSNVTLTEDGFHASHAGQNTIDSQQVTVAGTVGVSVGVGAGLIDTSLNHTGHVSVGGIDVSSATAVGAGIEANHTSIGLGAQLTHNASISIPTVTPGPTTEPPPEELQPTSSTPIPGSPGTAIGVYPPTKPIDTSSPPGSSPSSSSSSPSSPSAPPPSSSSGGGDNYAPPPNYQIAVSQYPYFFVPYPYPPPNVPQAPCNCPADQQNQQQGGQQPAGYLGFIPVLYIPNCHAQKSGLPANFNWPAPPPPEGFGQSLDELPAQRLFQKPDGSWVLQRARNRSRRLRGRRPAARRFLTGEPEIPGKK